VHGEDRRQQAACPATQNVVARLRTSTKYFKQRSSMPLVVRMTRAPVAKIRWIFSFVMSISRCRISSTCFVSVTTTCATAKKNGWVER